MEKATDLLAISLDDFCTALARSGSRRAYFVWDEAQGELRASSTELEPIARDLARNFPDFDAHEAIFVEVGAQTGALLGAFLHRTVRGQGAGGVRHWPYATLEDYLCDGLRLARAMGRKNALAGLWWGGGKGVIARQPGEKYRDPLYRKALYRDFGRFVSSLRGCYVSAEDVGTNADDMASVFETTRFVTCVPPAVGGSGNPSPATARGVVCAMEGALDFLSMGTLSKKRVVMQGIGNVGSEMVELLLDRDVSGILASDISADRTQELVARCRDPRLQVRLVSPGDTSVFEEPCDVFAPNALGGALDPETIRKLRARIVCGAANNQLFDDARDGELLRARGIVYVPDFVANRMGIVTCANEQYGVLPNDPAIERHYGRDWDNAIFVVTRRVLERAAREGTTPTAAANALADELGLEPHPIFGHRVRAIIDAVVAEGWEKGP